MSLFVVVMQEPNCPKTFQIVRGDLDRAIMEHGTHALVIYEVARRYVRSNRPLFELDESFEPELSEDQTDG